MMFRNFRPLTSIAAIVLLVSSLLAISSSYGLAQGTSRLCMSNPELRSFMHSVSMYSLGLGLGICARNYPHLRRETEMFSKALERNHQVFITVTETVAKRPFFRAYDSQGDTEFEKAVSAANASGKSQYEAYSLEQCRTHKTGVEVIFGGTESLQGDQLAANLDRMNQVFWSMERSRVPVCTSR